MEKKIEKMRKSGKNLRKKEEKRAKLKKWQKVKKPKSQKMDKKYTTAKKKILENRRKNELCVIIRFSTYGNHRSTRSENVHCFDILCNEFNWEKQSFCKFCKTPSEGQKTRSDKTRNLGRDITSPKGVFLLV